MDIIDLLKSIIPKGGGVLLAHKSMNIIQQIAEELQIKPHQVRNIQLIY